MSSDTGTVFQTEYQASASKTPPQTGAVELFLAKANFMNHSTPLVSILDAIAGELSNLGNELDALQTTLSPGHARDR